MFGGPMYGGPIYGGPFGGPQPMIIVNGQPMILGHPGLGSGGIIVGPGNLGGLSLLLDDDDHFTSSSSRNSTHMGIRELYHATSTSAAESILSSGRFLPGSNGCVGGGIYFADSASAARHKARASSDVVLKATVNLGDALVIRGGASGTYDESKLRSMGCESIYLPNGAAGGNAAAEYVVFNSNRVSNIRKG